MCEGDGHTVGEGNSTSSKLHPVQMGLMMTACTHIQQLSTIRRHPTKHPSLPLIAMWLTGDKIKVQEPCATLLFRPYLA